MQVLVKMPRTEIKIKAEEIPPSVLRVLKKEYGENVKIEDEEKAKDWFATEEHKAIDAEITSGFIVKTYRTNIRMTQAELGKKIGLSSNVISDIENDRRPVTAETAKKIAKVLPVSAARILKIE